MMNPAIVVLGSINIDLVVQTPRLPRPGETVLGGRFYRAHGGKGANQAVAAARGGSQAVAMVAAVGQDDHGRDALAALERDGIDCRWIKTVADEPTGVALIMVGQDGENCISVASGANALLDVEHVERAAEVLFDQAKVLLACLESPLESVACAFRRAKAAGVQTILNPAPFNEQLADSGLLSAVDILTPNALEATALTGIDVADGESAGEAARQLIRRGVGRVIVTLGPQGAVLADDQTQVIPPYNVKAVDTTAAGDAFNGALAAALAEGRPLQEAARWASAAAALAVTRPGAQPSLPSRREIARLTAQTE